MNSLPAPPPAWWSNVPWWGYFIFALLGLMILSVLAPFVRAWVKGMPSAMQSREHALIQGNADLRQRESEERERLVADRDRGWDLARGWVAKAHRLWHDHCNAVMQANGVLTIAHKIADGRMSHEAAQDRLGDFEPLPKPPPLPDVHLVEPKKPGETPYA